MTIAIPVPVPVAVPVPVPVPVPAHSAAPTPAHGLRRWFKRPRVYYVIGAVVLAVVVGFVVRRLTSRPPETDAVFTEAVSRQDISQSVEATGTVQAIDVVEIKSKASGQILRMPVVIGSLVQKGDLLAQIDPLTVRNQYAQSLAAQQSATAQVQVATSQLARAETLYSREAITATDHEAAVLALASAKASLARASSDLQIARQALADATVRAPSSGRVVEQNATLGMVITSATSGASGGTTILKMADLSRIEINALVAETDVGGLSPGMPAKVTVDAFPNRSFPGRVTMVEPQAVVQQSVTLFPVSVAIDNVNGALLPGMNGEVTIAIASHKQVLAVPLDAVRTLREAPTVAASLGLNADTLVAQLQRQVVARRAARANPAKASAPSAARGAAVAAAPAALTQFVVVRTANGYAPRLVALGISDFDYSEVLEGVTEGDQVALLSVAEQAAKRKAAQVQMTKRMGGNMSGSGSSSSSSGSSGSSSSGSGAR